MEEMMTERGLTGDHSSIARWVLAYAPELEKRVKSPLKPTTDSWKVAETYSKVKGVWAYPVGCKNYICRPIRHFLRPSFVMFLTI